MSKVSVCPVERWEGTVTFHDPLTLPQLAAYHRAVAEEEILRKTYRDSFFSDVMYYNALMPGVYACIQKFELKNWPGVIPELFPTKPSKDCGEMAAWLVDEIRKLITEAEGEVPKESTETPMPKQTAGKTKKESPSEVGN